MRYFKCSVCGGEYTLSEKKAQFNLKHYGEVLPLIYCFEDDGGVLIEIKQKEQKNEKRHRRHKLSN